MGVLSLLCHLAFAFTLGGMPTKRQRMEQTQRSARPAVSFEQVIEAYLKEDFVSVERLSGQYLSMSGAPRSDEVRQMRSVALVKLGRESILRATPEPLPVRAPVVASAEPLRQMGIEEHALYCVQVGSFSRQLNAERLLNRLLRNRYDAYLNKDAVRLVRVRVGHLATREEALKLQNRLEKDGYPTKIFP